MKNVKTIAFGVAVLLVLSGAWFLPSVAGQGSQSSLVQRVAVLEALVAELTASANNLTERVQALEDGQGSGTNSLDVLHMNPLDDFPANPIEGDLCIKQEIRHPFPDEKPWVYYLWCCVGGDWRYVAGYMIPEE